VDNLVAVVPAQRIRLFQEIKSMGVLNRGPRPVRSISIPKGNGTQSLIAIPTITDRVVSPPCFF